MINKMLVFFLIVIHHGVICMDFKLHIEINTSIQSLLFRENKINFLLRKLRSYKNIAVALDSIAEALE